MPHRRGLSLAGTQGSGSKNCTWTFQKVGKLFRNGSPDWGSRGKVKACGNPQFIIPVYFLIGRIHSSWLRWRGFIFSTAMLLQFGQAFSSRSIGDAWSLILRSLSSWASPRQPHERHSYWSVGSMLSSYHIQQLVEYPLSLEDILYWHPIMMVSVIWPDRWLSPYMDSANIWFSDCISEHITTFELISN